MWLGIILSNLRRTNCFLAPTSSLFISFDHYWVSLCFLLDIYRPANLPATMCQDMKFHAKAVDRMLPSPRAFHGLIRDSPLTKTLYLTA